MKAVGGKTHASSNLAHADFLVIPLPEDARQCPNEPRLWVTECGDVFRFRENHDGYIRLRPYIDKDGYKELVVNLDGKRKHFKIHHLVLTAFVGYRGVGQECRHLDGDPSNNHVGNLAWGTHKENIADSIVSGTRARGNLNGRTRLSEDDVIMMRCLSDAGVKVRGLTGLFSQRDSTVRKILSGRSWKYC